MVRVEHHFGLGQRVRLLRGNSKLVRGPSSCTIERLLPVDGQQPVYQVKSDAEPYSRVVVEADLAPGLPGNATAATTSQPPAP